MLSQCCVNLTLDYFIVSWSFAKKTKNPYLFFRIFDTIYKMSFEADIIFLNKIENENPPIFRTNIWFVHFKLHVFHFISCFPKKKKNPENQTQNQSLNLTGLRGLMLTCCPLSLFQKSFIPEFLLVIFLYLDWICQICGGMNL